MQAGPRSKQSSPEPSSVVETNLWPNFHHEPTGAERATFHTIMVQQLNNNGLLLLGLGRACRGSAVCGSSTSLISSRAESTRKQVLSRPGSTAHVLNHINLTISAFCWKATVPVAVGLSQTPKILEHMLDVR